MHSLHFDAIHGPRLELEARERHLIERVHHGVDHERVGLVGCDRDGGLVGGNRLNRLDPAPVPVFAEKDQVTLSTALDATTGGVGSGCGVGVRVGSGATEGSGDAGESSVGGGVF